MLKLFRHARKRRPKTTLALLIVVLFFIISFAATPSYRQIKKTALGSDRVLLTSNGDVLQTLRTDFNKRRLSWYPIVNFPKSLQESVIFAEDRRFRYHFGFDPIGLSRALWADLRRHKIQGASTITMQLSDLIQDDVLSQNQPIKKGSFVHKIVQVFRAIGLEIRWTKTEILEAYLNLIHLRGEYQGVPAVSYAFLNKHPLALDATESAVIAASISSPNQRAVTLKQRACQIYFRLTENTSPNIGTRSCAELETAVAEFATGAPSIQANVGLAPHLARRLFSENPNDTQLTSTIDPAIQKTVAAILEKNIFRLRASNVHDSAAIVIDNQTGRVLAYVGAVSTSESPHVDGVQSYRQAGSALKPFIYGRAIENRTLTASSILLDEPTGISWGGGVYRPANYDRHFSGPVSVREALASSLNVPAVKTAIIVGLRHTYATLQSIGLTNMRDPDFYGVSMALGAVEVRLEDLANAYRMLANGGEWTPLRYLETPLEKPAPARRVFTPEAAFVIGNILSDPNARAIGFGWETPLETPFWTAVKTGTSKDYRDNWCMGFSERYTVGVWAGNFNAEAMEKVSGVSGVGPSWYEIMSSLHEHLPSLAPQFPAGIETRSVRHQWATLPYREVYLKGTTPNQELIEPSTDQRPQFIFPSENSVLVTDPHLDQDHVALYIRFAGSMPDDTQVVWDGKTLGKAVSPFRVDHPAGGSHRLALVTGNGKVLNSVSFYIRGAK